jgi:spore maturation protein CgeB
LLIAYCGDLWEGSTAKMRLEALQRLGHRVIGVDTTRPLRGLHSMWVRAARRVGWAIDTAGANRALLDLAKQHKLEVVWIDKGLTIRPRTLRTLRETAPGVRLVHYSLDDMRGKHNQSRQYLAGIPLYDLHATNKSYNVAELQSMGATRVLFVNNAFCPTLHRPVAVSSEDRERWGGPVGFIGGFEKERADAIWSLVTGGIPVRVWGETWGSGWVEWAALHQHPALKVEQRAVFGAEYAKAICSFDINLAFLRRSNRDLQTTRSVEIPACGAFMLAQRTAEHQQLFQEGVEAEFFSNHDELFKKCRHYLTHSEARSQIARAGLERCTRSDYSYDRQLHTVLERLNC